MKKKQWSYVVNVKFGEYSPHANGKAMYFDHLRDAYRQLLSLEKYSLLMPFAGQMVSEASINDLKEGKELMRFELVKAAKRIGDMDIETPGLYYYFPSGINNFEHKSGIMLSQFAGAEQQSLIMAAYLVAKGLEFRETIIHEALQKEVRNMNELPYRISLTSKFFGENLQRDRNVHAVPFKEEFYFNDSKDALIELLFTDFNKLDESVAWENNMDSFHVNSKLIFANKAVAAELLSVRTDTFRLDYIGILEHGIYLSGNSSMVPSYVDLPLKNLNSNSSNWVISQVGQYNLLKNEANKIVELDRYLQNLEEKNLTESPGKKQPIQKKASIKKRKGKGL